MNGILIFDSFNDFYQFNNFEIESGYVTDSWSNQLLVPILLCNRFMVKPGSTIRPVWFKKHYYFRKENVFIFLIPKLNKLDVESEKNLR